MDKGITLSTRMKMVGKSLAGLNFGSALTNAFAPAPFLLNSSNYQGEPFGSSFWMFEQSGRDVWFSFGGNESAVKAYTGCPPLSAIINKKAGAFATGKNWILNTSGKGKGKESNSEAAVKLRKLMARPNPLQSWKQFEAQTYIYQQIFGYAIILPIKPAGFPNIDATSIWNIPPNMVDIQENKDFWYLDGTNVIKSIKLSYKGHSTLLDPEDVFILKDFVPSFTSQIIPESRIKALEQPINNIKAAYSARGSLIDDRGALGMISSDKSDDSGKIPMSPTEKKDVQEEFAKYGIRKGQFKYIITTAALKWTSIGYSTKDLMLFEEIEDDIMRICDSYSVPFRLMSNARNNSLGGSDAGEFNKQLYQDTIMPEAESMYDQWNLFFNTSAYGIILDKDFTHLPILQQDKVKEATARFNRNKALEIEFRYNLITMNRWLELNGEDTIGTEGDKYYSEIREELGNPIASAGGLNGNESGSGQDSNNSNTQNNGN